MEERERLMELYKELTKQQETYIKNLENTLDLAQKLVEVQGKAIEALQNKNRKMKEKANIPTIHPN